ncbi:hypothetical protein LIER_35298 [Lithospermum erythrorhizon]|uniref:FAR1 domain-containing protein n=1 Tax=Lithospermum erythrorhizon TaxID=34254 RepID=A0AAV3NPP0_LITER
MLSYLPSNVGFEYDNEFDDDDEVDDDDQVNDDDVPDIKYNPADKTSYQDLVFQTDVEAYSFYSSYAKSKGFSIKKVHVYIDSENKKNEIPYYLNYMCHKQGLKAVRKMKIGAVSVKKGDDSKKKVCERSLTRIDCET